MRRLTSSEKEDYNIDWELEKRIKNYLKKSFPTSDNSTVLAEETADYFNQLDWLDDETHPIWEWVIDLPWED